MNDWEHFTFRYYYFLCFPLITNNVYQFTGFIRLQIKEYKSHPQPTQAHPPSISYMYMAETGISLRFTSKN